VLWVLRVGLIDFAVNFCCPYQYKWLPGGPSPNSCSVSSVTLNLTHSLTHLVTQYVTALMILDDRKGIWCVRLLAFL